MHNGDEMSENPQAFPSIGDHSSSPPGEWEIPVIGRMDKEGRVHFLHDGHVVSPTGSCYLYNSLSGKPRVLSYSEHREEIENMDIADANLVWWIQLGGTCCFLVGAVCLLVAHILGRP